MQEKIESVCAAVRTDLLLLLLHPVSITIRVLIRFPVQDEDEVFRRVATVVGSC